MNEPFFIIPTWGSSSFLFYSLLTDPSYRGQASEYWGRISISRERLANLSPNLSDAAYMNLPNKSSKIYIWEHNSIINPQSSTGRYHG